MLGRHRVWTAVSRSRLWWRPDMLITDLDGVICDLVSEYLLRAAQITGVPHRAPWEITHHDKFLDVFGALGPAMREMLLDLLLGRPDYVYVSARPYFCGIKLLNWWWTKHNDKTQTVHVVSSRPAALADVTESWLRRWIGERGQRSETYWKVHLEGSKQKKIDTMFRLACESSREDNFIFDDDPEVIEQLSGMPVPGAPGTTTVVLVPQPWNNYGGADSRVSTDVSPTLGFLDEGAIVWR